jgi:hypothetical protein
VGWVKDHEKGILLIKMTGRPRKCSYRCQTARGSGEAGKPSLGEEDLLVQHPKEGLNDQFNAQLTAFFTSAPILASSTAVSSFNAKTVGHMYP